VYEKSWWDAKVAPTGDTFLRILADQTGGILRTDERFDRERWRKQHPPFRDILEAVHKTYAVRVSVSGIPAGMWPLDVRVTQPGVRVHAPKWLSIRAAAD
jgi:hypothetical protein